MDSPSLSEMVTKAKTAYKTEDFEVAAQWYERAAAQYTRQDDPLNAAEMANNRSVCLLRQGNPQSAYRASLGTEKVFAEVGDLRRQGMALGNQAAALEALHKYDDAISTYLQSNEVLKQVDDAALRISLLQSLSGLQLRRRHVLQAMATMRAALIIKPDPSLQERILKKLLEIVFNLLGR